MPDNKVIVIEEEAPSEETLREYEETRKKVRRLAWFMMIPFVMVCYGIYVINIMFPSGVRFKWNVFLERADRHKTEIIILFLMVALVFFMMGKLFAVFRNYLALDSKIERYEAQHEFAMRINGIKADKVLSIGKETVDSLVGICYTKNYKKEELLVPDAKIMLTELNEDANIVVDFKKHKIYSIKI